MLTIYRSSIDAGVKMRPSPEELEEWGPEFRLRWESYFKDVPDRAALFMGPLAM
jgi:alcohol oxidase